MRSVHHTPRLLVALLVLLMTPCRVTAQSAPADTTDHFKFSADLGLVVASGNTNVLTFSFSQVLDLLFGSWSVHQAARMVNSSADGAETANEYGGLVQPEYRLSRRVKAYALGSWDRNPFLGIVQRFQEGIGLSYAAIAGPHHFLTLEGGASLFQQEFTSGISTSFPTARAQATWKYAFARKAYLQDMFIYLPSLQDAGDYRINNELALVAPLFAHFALKATYLLQFQSAPQPGFGTTDNLFTTGLQVTF